MIILLFLKYAKLKRIQYVYVYVYVFNYYNIILGYGAFLFLSMYNYIFSLLKLVIFDLS